MMRLIFAFFLFFTNLLFSQSEETIDVLSYDIAIEVSDLTDKIFAKEYIQFRFLNKNKKVSFDLSSQNNEAKGMDVVSVMLNGETVKYSHANNRLSLFFSENQLNSDTLTVLVQYKGVPIDGLVIGQNKYGKRTFFCDNWPNRAHHWLVCNDHPSDKAKINLTVVAPRHYEVIATGKNVKNEILSNQKVLHYFKSDIVLPTKVMVFGAADFKILQENDSLDFPVSSWLYEDEIDSAFNDLKCANEILSFFINKIGDYPFEKLANVQSTTRYGGMENAGNIFYDEHAFSGEKQMEALVAHEIAHQWFGNSASEKDWQHLWLSEGFATYFTDLYWGYKYGEKEMQERLSSEREKVIRFSKKYKHSVIDTNYVKLSHLLNPNSYQKGAWVLHMLRNEVGEELFWEIIRKYYSDYQFSNAKSSDFIEIVNRITEKDYYPFFNQWLKRSGQPKLKVDKKEKGKDLVITIEQIQNEDVFFFPLEILYTTIDGAEKYDQYNINSRSTEILIEDGVSEIISITLDPKVKLLYEQ